MGSELWNVGMQFWNIGIQEYQDQKKKTKQNAKILESGDVGLLESWKAVAMLESWDASVLQSKKTEKL